MSNDQAQSEPGADVAHAVEPTSAPGMPERERILLELLQRAERAARVGAFVDPCDSPGGIVWSDTLHRIMGVPLGATPSRERALDAFAPAVAAVLRDFLHRMTADGQPLEIELPLAPAPGRAEWVRLYLVPHMCGGRCAEISGAVQDISDRKRLELEVVGAAEAERSRIGADLHDDLGQVLTGLSLQVTALRRAVQRGPEGLTHQAKLAEIETTLENAREACRRLARSYVVPITASALGGMLEQLVLDVPHPVRCSVRADPLPAGTPAATAQELYRIAQEAVTNAVRHSRCRTLQIELFVTAQRLILCIEDDGVGFDPARAAAGVGLVSLRLRAARIGGVLELSAGESGGTRVAVAAARGGPAEIGAPPMTETRYGVLRLVWQPEYACGEPTLDHQHCELFEYANRLIDAVSGPAPDPIPVHRAFQRLIDHVRRHFRTEEALLRARGFPHLAEHAAAHARLVERAVHLKAAADAGHAAFGSVVDFLANEVVAGHLIGADRQFYPLFAPPAEPGAHVTP